MNIVLKNKYFVFFLLGIFNSLPFIFENLSFISWFSFSLFLFIFNKVLDEKLTKKGLFICITLFYFAYYFVTFSFFAVLYPLTFVGIGYIASFFILLFAWLVMSLAFSLFVSFLTHFSLKLSNNRVITLLNVSLSFLLAEFFESIGPLAFAWSRFSLPQYNNPYLIQSAALFGPYFIDFIILMCNTLIALIFITPKKKYIPISLLTLTFLSNLLYGIFCMNKSEPIAQEAKVMLVQGNMLTDSKWKGESSFSVYMKKTRSDFNDADIVLWSETAIPTLLNESKSLSKELLSFSTANDTEMIVGAFYSDKLGKVYNGAYHITPNGISDKIYLKRRLVPFGEYLPFSSLLKNLPFLDDINLLTSDLSRGTSTKIMSTSKGKIGTLICFDSVFQILARDSVSDGAELLAVITNDSWYKDSPAVYQHNAQSVWRAVENGRWVVRCANSGISSVINSHGQIISYLPPLKEGTIIQRVNFIKAKTLYTHIGDSFIILIVLYFVFLLFKKRKVLLNKSTNSKI